MLLVTFSLWACARNFKKKCSEGFGFGQFNEVAEVILDSESFISLWEKANLSGGIEQDSARRVCEVPEKSRPMQIIKCLARSSVKESTNRSILYWKYRPTLKVWMVSFAPFLTIFKNRCTSQCWLAALAKIILWKSWILIYLSWFAFAFAFSIAIIIR